MASTTHFVRIRRLRLALLLGGALAGAPSPAVAQMPGAPVLQNAWANAGITLAGNLGRGPGVQTLAVAVAWAPSQSRFQLSAGGGVVRPDSGKSYGGYGARLSIPIRDFAAGRLGTAIFGGFGVAAIGGARESNFPIGAAVGYRHAVGATRGLSVYVAPFVVIGRRPGRPEIPDDRETTSTLVRASAGVDVTIMPQLGLTVGYEGGATATGAEPGVRGGVFGVALSYALRRQP